MLTAEQLLVKKVFFFMNFYNLSMQSFLIKCNQIPVNIYYWYKERGPSSVVALGLFSRGFDKKHKLYKISNKI